MATSKILSTFESDAAPAIHIETLPTAYYATCEAIDNSTVRASMAMVFLRVKTADHAPTANTPIKVYLIRHSNQGTNLADNAISKTHSAAGGVSGEPTQAECLGAIIVTAGTDTTYEKSFLAYDLSPFYQFAVYNGTGQHLSNTDTDFVLQVIPITPEAQ